MMVVGHWHTWRLWAREKGIKFSELTNETFDCSIFYIEDKIVGLDGCSNSEIGRVNAFVYETDEEPILYKGVR